VLARLVEERLKAASDCESYRRTTLILFSVFPSPALTYLFPIFFGMGYASVAALPPLITADLFEGRAYGGIFGWLMMLVAMGGAFGAWFAGLLHDYLGSYRLVFVILMVITFFSCLCVWWAAPRRIRAVPGKMKKDHRIQETYSQAC